MTRFGAPRALLVVALGGAFGTVLASCEPSSSSSNCPSTQAEIDFGCGPSTNGSITYQPNVVLIPAGADAVRSRSSDGITWTMKGDAAGVSDLAPGKIMFATGLDAGRVVAVKQSGSDRVVTLAPATFTDVIQDADLGSTSPLSFANPHQYTATALPATTADIAPSSSSASPIAAHGPGVVSLPAISLSAARVALPGARLADVTYAGDFNAHSYCCQSRLGINFDYDKGGLRMKGIIEIHLSSPSVTWRFTYHSGKVDAALRIDGVDGVAAAVEAAIAADGKNIDKLFQLPVDFDVPVTESTKGRLPMHLSVREYFIFETDFRSHTSTLKASGAWNLQQPMIMRVRDYAHPELLSAPQGLTVRNSIVKSITGLGIGAAAITLGQRAVFCMCLGSSIDSAGLTYAFSWYVVMKNDSSAQALVRGFRCRGADLGISVEYGLGYSIPQAIIDEFNKTYAEPNGITPLVADSTIVYGSILKAHDTEPPGTKACGI